jgi:lipoprotein-releasing system permease protein
VVRLGVISVAVGLAVMIVSVAIVTGFQKQISDKVIGFGAHIIVSNYETNISYETPPLYRDQSFYLSIDTIKGISHIQISASKAGIIKTEDQIEGVILKGVGSDFNWSFFENKIITGHSFVVKDSVTTNEVLISENTASKLKLKPGDPLRMYFLSGHEVQPRGRKFTITGIYETGLEEFDNLFIIGDIHHIQKINEWNDNEIGGYEIFIDDFNNLDKISEAVDRIAGFDLKTTTIKELYPQIFEWLSLQDINVVVILALMSLVAGITMISTLLILILEKTSLIGILKALGAENRRIRKIFIYNAVYLTGKGLLWGNVIAIGLSLLQIKTGVLKLDQQSYYISEVPVNLQLLHILIINFCTILLVTLMLIIPTLVITRISPVKAIRFR